MLDFDALVPDQYQIELYKANHDDQIVEQCRDRNYDDSCYPWLWNGKPIDQPLDQHQSFVYLITNKITGKQYIGFKTTTSRKTRVIKGKKKRTYCDSDWKTYYSSSQNLLHDVGIYGRGNFIREVIAWTVDKSVGKYVEALVQFQRNVLTTDHDRYYNGIINLRLNHRTLSKFDHVVWADYNVGDQIYHEKSGRTN